MGVSVRNSFQYKDDWQCVKDEGPQEVEKDPFEELEESQYNQFAEDEGAHTYDCRAEPIDNELQDLCTQDVPITTIASFTYKGREVLEKLARLQALAPAERASSSEAIVPADRYKVSQSVIAYAIKDFPQNQCPSLTYKQVSKLAESCAKLFFDEDVAIWFNIVKPLKPSSFTAAPGASKYLKPRPHGILWDRMNNVRIAWGRQNPELKKKRAEEKRAKAQERKEKPAKRRRRRRLESTGLHKRGRPSEDETDRRIAEESLSQLWGDDDVQNLLGWKDYTKVDDAILGSFKASSAKRLAYLQLKGSDAKAYLDFFPFFTSSTVGPMLLRLEFEYLFPDVKKDQLLSELGTYGPAIIHLTKTGTGYKEAQQLVQLYENATDVRLQATAALLTLAFAAHTGGLKKIPGEVHRLKPISRMDSSISFCSFYATAAEKEEHHEKLLKEHQNAVQPYVVVIGTPTAVERCHVRFLGHDLAVDNVLEAIDLCFKCFHVFNLHYPFECEHLWFVVQQLFYDIPRSADQRHVRSAQLIEGLRSYTNRFLPAVDGESGPLEAEMQANIAPDAGFSTKEPSTSLELESVKYEVPFP